MRCVASQTNGTFTTQWPARAGLARACQTPVIFLSIAVVSVSKTAWFASTQSYGWLGLSMCGGQSRCSARAHELGSSENGCGSREKGTRGARNVHTVNILGGDFWMRKIQTHRPRSETNITRRDVPIYLPIARRNISINFIWRRCDGCDRVYLWSWC